MKQKNVRNEIARLAYIMQRRLLRALAAEHTWHCAARIAWGDGECECGRESKHANGDPRRS